MVTLSRGGGIAAALYAHLDRVEQEHRRLSTATPAVPLSREEQAGQSTELLRIAVRRAEDAPEFETLVREVAASVSTSEGSLRHPVSVFLRRSRAYFSRDRAEVARRLEERLHSSGDRRIVHLVSLPWLDPSTLKLPLDFGWFRITKYSPDELRQLIDNDVREVFFPYSALEDHHTVLLTRECWLEVEERAALAPLFKLPIDFSILGGRVEYSNLPDPVQRALERVLLLKWVDPHGLRDTWWGGFPVGTWIILDDDWSRSPARIKFGRTAYDEFDEGHLELTLTQYECQNPDDVWALHGQLADLEEASTAPFLTDVALPHFVKACLTEGEGPAKVDQFVNHVIALDALLGEPTAGARSRLMSRAAALLGRRDVAPKVGKLYEKRSALVHGNPVKEIRPELSWEAHEIASEALRRAVHILATFLRRNRQLKREEFLAALDLASVAETDKRMRAIVAIWTECGRTAP